jgi:hypothetical protein
MMGLAMVLSPVISGVIAYLLGWRCWHIHTSEGVERLSHIEPFAQPRLGARGGGQRHNRLGAHLGASTITMRGMVALGSGGRVLNGETQKAIMSVVPRERAGMASGISTTSRFAGILLGFAGLSGVIATMARNFLIHASCAGDRRCNYATSFADAVVAGDLPRALSGLTGTKEGIAMAHARLPTRPPSKRHSSRQRSWRPVPFICS